jgi:hypothetical protein
LKYIRYSLQHQVETKSAAYLASRSNNTRELTDISYWEWPCMTEYLIAARAVIILWTNLAVMPAEVVFDVIEAELERRGIEP